MSRKKNRSTGPKTKKRPARLQSAKHWIPTYTGKHIVRGYRKRFHVDVTCAIQDLRMLGVRLDESYVAQVIQSHEHMICVRQKKKEEKNNTLVDSVPYESDDNFYYIAGYTSGGFPYGITWEEVDDESHIEW